MITEKKKKNSKIHDRCGHHLTIRPSKFGVPQKNNPSCSFLPILNRLVNGVKKGRKRGAFKLAHQKNTYFFFFYIYLLYFSFFQIYSMRATTDGRFVFVGGFGMDVWVYDTKTHKPTHYLKRFVVSFFVYLFLS